MFTSLSHFQYMLMIISKTKSIVPLLFYLFISDIEVEGLFRKTGSNARQMLLKEMLNKSSDLNLDEGQFSPHDCASVLKGFLKELPECLMVDKFAKAHCQLCGKTFSKFLFN